MSFITNCLKRKFCDDNSLVVGTPILQMYYNGRSIRFRFLRNIELTTKNLETKPSNVYIGQLHFNTIKTLVSMTEEGIKKQGDGQGDIIVDVNVDILYTGGKETEQEEDSYSGTEDDTDSGEETDSGDDDDDDEPAGVHSVKKSSVENTRSTMTN